MPHSVIFLIVMSTLALTVYATVLLIRLFKKLKPNTKHIELFVSLGLSFLILFLAILAGDIWFQKDRSIPMLGAFMYSMMPSVGMAIEYYISSRKEREKRRSERGY